MATFSNGESGSSVRAKLNEIIEKVEGTSLVGNDIKFGDNDKAIFGAGSDLQIYHSGAHSFIDDAGQGNLYIRANNLSLGKYTGEAYITTQADGNVELYFDNDPKLATTSTGVDVTGVITADGLTLGDAHKAIFGAGSDLQIYHDGFNSYIEDAGTGYLVLKTGGIGVAVESSVHGNLLIAQDDFVKLYNAGSEKLATTSTGVDVTGTVTADGLTVDGNINANGLIIADNGEILAGQDESGFYYGSGFNTDNTLPILIGDNNASIRLRTGNAPNRLQIAGNGDISFYEDTGTTPKFFWDASTERLGIGNAAPTTTLDVTGTVTADGLTIDPASTPVITMKDATGANGYIIRSSVTSTSDFGLRFRDIANKELMQIAQNGDISFYEDTGTTAKFFWDASAERLGLGTTSPDVNLDIEGINSPQIRVTDTGGSVTTKLMADTVRGYVGTQTNVNFSILTNNTVRATFDTSGNVGIGTSSPSRELDVAGNIKVGTGSTGGAWIYLQDNDSLVNGFYVGQNSAETANLWNSENTAMLFATNNAERMRITSTGSVGIGTSSPIHGTVEVSKSSVGSHNALAFSVRDGTYNPRVIISHDTTSSSQLLKFDSSYSSSTGFADFAFMNGNVGIGTSSPSASLTVTDGSSAGTLSIGNNAVSTSVRYLQFGESNDYSIQSNANSYLRFYAGGAEAARFDASGNLLVGKTSGAIGTAGSAFYSYGLVESVRDGNKVMTLNRLTSDGTIVDFRKDGTTVGSIGTFSGRLTIGNDDTGITFQGASDTIYPSSPLGVGADDKVILGNSGTRFKDLYLSGGVYLGGTGAANKLDDYEEGTFSPVIRDATSGGNTANSYLFASGRYTKVGRMVHVTINFVNVNTTGMTSGNNVYVTGLPFTSVNSFGYPAVPVNVSSVSSTNGFVRGSVFYNSTYLSLSEGTTTGGASLTVSDLTSGDADIYINFSYEVQ